MLCGNYRLLCCILFCFFVLVFPLILVSVYTTPGMYPQFACGILICFRSQSRFFPPTGRCPILQWALNRELSFADELDVFGRTPVHYAAEEGHITALRTFSKFSRVHLDVKDFLGRTPRLVSTESDDDGEEIKKKLLFLR